ncbi:MAG: carbon-nitrogen hydrolase family protein [Caldilineaceae bacterium]
MTDQLTVGIAQIAPVWLNRDATLAKIVDYTNQAADAGCQLVAFGEALLPGYPIWIDWTDGARFDSPVQKRIHAHYVDQAVQIEAGHLRPLQQAAAKRSIAAYVGTVERAADRGGHSIYCSLVYIDARGEIQSVHRKLMPTYQERMTWSTGDGHGLRTHGLGAFTVGGLNCWENWMPLPRAALYALGEDLHVAVWPGGAHNTVETTRFLAREGRSYVLAASGLLRISDLPADTPHLDIITADMHAELADGILSNGGSAMAGPDGQWMVEPVTGVEKLIVATLDHLRVREERQNFDPAGHYSRPDVTKLTVDRRRQSTIEIVDAGGGCMRRL